MLQKNAIQPNSLELLIKLQVDKELKEFHLAGDTSLALQIGHRKSIDFIDIYFILKRYSVNELLNFYKKKYEARNLFHVLKSLIYFDDISTQDWPEMILEKKLHLSKVKKYIANKVDEFSKKL